MFTMLSKNIYLYPLIVLRDHGCFQNAKICKLQEVLQWVLLNLLESTEYSLLLQSQKYEKKTSSKESDVLKTFSSSSSSRYHYDDHDNKDDKTYSNDDDDAVFAL